MTGRKARGDRAGPVTGASGKYLTKSAWTSGLGGFGGTFLCFHRPQIHIKQRLVLVALILILLPQLDDFLEDFYIKFLSARLQRLLLNS